MKIEDRRVFRYPKLYFKQCYGGDYVYTYDPGELVIISRGQEWKPTAVQVRKNKIIAYHVNASVSGRRHIKDEFSIPDKHKPLQTLYHKADEFGVVHTDGKHLYVSFKSGDMVHTFNLGSPKSVALYDTALAYQTRRGNWQVIPQLLPYITSYYGQSRDTTSLKDKFRAKLPYIDSKTDGNVIGVATNLASGDKTVNTFVITDTGKYTLYHQGDPDSSIQGKLDKRVLDRLIKQPKVPILLTSRTVLLLAGDTVFASNIAEDQQLAVLHDQGSALVQSPQRAAWRDNENNLYVMDSLLPEFSNAQAFRWAGESIVKVPLRDDQKVIAFYIVGSTMPVGIEPNMNFHLLHNSSPVESDFREFLIRAVQNPNADPVARKRLYQSPSFFREAGLCG